MFSLKKVTVAATLLTTLVGISSCKMTKNLDEMHDSTVAMNGKMDQTNQTMGDMKKTTEGMSGVTCAMYRSLRQGNAKVSRDQDLQDIKAAKNIKGMLAEAAEYMQGFEYQVWSNVCGDELPRDQVIEQSVRELLTKIQTFETDRSDVKATHQSEDYYILYALSATLHYTNALQKGLLVGTEEKEMRPLDVLTKGLEIDQAKNRGSYAETTIPSYVEVVGKYQKDAVFLLRLRANFLMAYAYAIADSDSFGNDPNFMKKAWRITMTKFFSKQWAPKIDTRTTTEINERLTVSLVLANETRLALIALGMDPMTDQTLLKIWKLADFTKFDLTKMEKSGDKELALKAKSIRELIAARDALFMTPSSLGVTIH